MPRSSRLKVCLATVIQNSSKSHWHRIDHTPPHDAVNRRHRSLLDHRRQRRPVRVVEPRGLPVAPCGRRGHRDREALTSPPSPAPICSVTPPNRRRPPARSPPHTIAASATQTPRLRRVLHPPCNPAQLRRIEDQTGKQNKHGRASSSAMLNQIRSPSESTPSHALRDLV